jgi:transcriptional regulator with XRE-family HTH domain
LSVYPQSAIRNPQSAIRYPQSAIRNPPSAIRNPQSAIRNPQSAIDRAGFRRRPRPQSATRNPQSAIRNRRMPAESDRSALPPPMFDFAVMRAIRKREGLTLEETARRAGLSVAVLSRLERNQTVAELETLYKLGRVFGMTATDLLALAEAPLAHRKQEETYRSDGFRFRVVRYANHSVYLGEAPAGACVRKPEIHHDEHETCWVIDGRIRLTLPHQTVELGAGASLQFDAIQEHAYAALEDSRLIIIHLKKGNRY